MISKLLYPSSSNYLCEIFIPTDTNWKQHQTYKMTDTKSSDDVIVSHEMPSSASKTPSPEKEVVPANQKKRKPPPTISKSLVGLCKIAAKHLPLVVGVYAMGYFNFSIAWILGIVGITAATDQWRKERNYRMSTARASAIYDDKDVIMARVSDLPSWVSANHSYLFSFHYIYLL